MYSVYCGGVPYGYSQPASRDKIEVAKFMLHCKLHAIFAKARLHLSLDYIRVATLLKIIFDVFPY